MAFQSPCFKYRLREITKIQNYEFLKPSVYLALLIEIGTFE